MNERWKQEDIEQLIQRALGMWNEWAEYTAPFIQQGATPEDRYARSMVIRAIMIAAVQCGGEVKQMTVKQQVQLAGMAATTMNRIGEMDAEHEAQKIMDALTSGTLGE